MGSKRARKAAAAIRRPRHPAVKGLKIEIPKQREFTAEQLTELKNDMFYGKLTPLESEGSSSCMTPEKGEDTQIANETYRASAAGPHRNDSDERNNQWPQNLKGRNDYFGSREEKLMERGASPALSDSTCVSYCICPGIPCFVRRQYASSTGEDIDIDERVDSPLLRRRLSDLSELTGESLYGERMERASRSPRRKKKSITTYTPRI
ncbi:hypothetical protein WOLCODRAFT_155112 [Wolfiporia cocos MD-104 SS10]|uniref:Uncharacterized protein n=1 Tax=Wolfiporia cocos (strain MD-104) TaxID=742152 RepID=A0A2H3JYN4_WOLCO|nr:hypothetical protein WOLCODRAFT_155112 [Wolfiporia cocos MD-104 SS10]